MHALQLADPKAAEVFDPKAWKRIKDRSREIQLEVNAPVPKGLKATLRPYQIEGFRFLAYLAVNRFGGLLADDMGLGIEFERVGGFDPVAFDEGCVGAVRSAAERLGYSHMNLISGAGHDACWINKVAPTAMVMCPCVGGLSHNEAEEISREWAKAGTDVLMHAVVETAEVVG